jgi:hypothetical protein
MTQHVSDDGVSAVTYEMLPSITSVPGLSFNSVSGILDYDGIGAASATSHQLRATDAVGDATSASFDIRISDTSELEADWTLRSSQPGVVWHHNFANAAEVDAFRWTGDYGNDPDDDSGITGKTGTISHQTSDGITGGGCLEMLRTVGSVDPTHGNLDPSAWWRPLDPINGAGNGRGVDDPGANGTISVKTWTPVAGGGQTLGWTGGAYGHPDYHAASPGQFDGHDYWFQARVKLDSRRALTENQPGANGKLFYFSRTDKSFTTQEIVTVSGKFSPADSPPWFAMYRSGSPPLVDDDPGSSNQPNNERGFCDWPGTISACWSWSHGWDTMLYHVIPMKHEDGKTVVQCWAQTAGETGYTRVWDQKNIVLPFNTSGAVAPEGHNAVICSGYMNGKTMTEFYHRWDELIFQHGNYGPIPAPRTTKTVIQSAADALAEGGEHILADNPFSNALDVQWMTSVIYFDPIRNQIQYMGKAASSQDDSFYHYYYDCDSDTWTEPFNPVFVGTGSTGHLWCHAFDQIEGNYYMGHYNRSQVRRFDPATASTSAAWTLLPDTAVNMGGTAAGRTLHDGTAPIYGWHPNLFGPGQPGLFVLNLWGRSFGYNPADDTWKLLQESGTQPDPFGGRNNGQAIYIPETDQLAIFSQHNEGGSNNVVLWVDAGVGNATNAVEEGYITAGTNTFPFIIAGKGGGVRQGKVVNHPEDPNRLLLFEQGGTGQVYDSTDYGDTWVLRTSSSHPGRYQHTFDAVTEAFTIGSLPLQKCVIGIASNGGQQIKLWKPGL